MANTQQRAAFLAALTATDQMAPAERQRLTDDARRSAKNRAKGERYVAWMEACGAYHDTEAARVRAIVVRVAGLPEKVEREVAHALASLAMLKAFQHLMLLPLVGADDAKERRAMIRKGHCATDSGANSNAYAAITVEWLAHIEADAARLERKA